MLHELISRAEVRITSAWPAKQILGRSSAPIATITFDDFPRSAWTTGAPILESVGARATFFVSAAFSPERLRRSPAPGFLEGVRYFELDDVVAAHAQGHEIGCHSFDHRNMSLVKTAELEQSIRRNAEFVKALLGDVIMTSFAFPFGTISIRTKRLMSRHFAACRGIRRGINAGLFDLSNLKSVELIPEILEKYSVGQFIQEAKARNGWLIITTHDVSSSPSPWGCTPQLLQSVVSALVSNGIEILPMKHALARFFFR